jgi:hypothetical protein
MTNGDDVKIAKEAGSTVTKVLTEKARPKFSSILPSIFFTDSIYYFR